MTDMPDISLRLWRELCRHQEIGTALTQAAPILHGELPLRAVYVRRIDVSRRQLETVAEDARDVRELLPHGHTELTEPQLEALLAFCREGRIAHGIPSEHPLLGLMVPRGLRGEIVAGPLTGEDGVDGILLLVGSRRFEPAHFEKAQEILEPFRLALENDRRFHELLRLREAVEADNRALRSRLERQDIVETIVGTDGGLREVNERIAQVASTDVPVLVLGETGTGKEVVARSIHARSGRAKGPMVCVNCGAIPPGLVDSELFGHERGSFTGASGTRKGWFERADGGTLFLDEVGELPLDAQVRLLRVLQERMFERVGGTRAVHVDVRIVAATHRNLEDMVAASTFREDLWYRLSIFPVYLPPLRERPSDVPALAAHFAWKAGRRLGGTPLVPSEEDVEILLSYDWPGNVRELASVIERAAILGGGKRLNVAGALGLRTQGSARPSSPLLSASLQSPGRVTPPRAIESELVRLPSASHFPTLDEAMCQHIERALQQTGGRIEGKGGAADLLDINPHTLRSRMKKLGVSFNRYQNGLEISRGASPMKSRQVPR
jgi:hydrogenase-4 transcriptional activator